MYMNMVDAERRLDVVKRRANAEAATASQAEVAKRERTGQRFRSYQTGADPRDANRRSRRIGLDSEVLVRRLGSFNFQAELKDVSTGGCRVQMIEECEVDEALVTRFPQLEPLGARVRWANGMVAGLEFSTALHPAVFDALLARLGAPANCNSEEPPADEA